MDIKSKKIDHNSDTLESKFDYTNIVSGTFLISLLVAILFAVGSAYYGGYLLYWGLEADSFVKSFPEMLYMGFMALFNIAVFDLMSPAIYLIYIAMILIVFLAINGPELIRRKYNQISQKNGSKKKNIEEENSKKIIESEQDSPSIKNLQKLAYFSGGFLIFVLVTSLLLSSAEKHGENSAFRIHGKLAEGKEQRLFLDKGHSLPQDDAYYRIACNSLECAIYWYQSEKVEIVERKRLLNTWRKLSYKEKQKQRDIE